MDSQPDEEGYIDIKPPTTPAATPIVDLVLDDVTSGVLGSPGPRALGPLPAALAAALGESLPGMPPGMGKLNYPKRQDGMTELDALHWIVNEHHGTIESIHGAYPNPFMGGHTEVHGVIVTVGTHRLWAPSVLDAAIVLKARMAAHITTPRRSG